MCESGEATPERVHEFLVLGVDLNATALLDIRTPLHLVAANNENPEVVNLLINAGADVNAVDGNGSTPLHATAKFNENPEVLTVLIRAEADVNAKDEIGQTPLDRATSPPSGGEPNPKNADVLRVAGASLARTSPHRHHLVRHRSPAHPTPTRVTSRPTGTRVSPQSQILMLHA